MADKAELLTPLMRLRRRHRAAKAFGALLAVGLALLFGIVLSVNEGRNYQRLVTWLEMDKYLARPFAASPPPALHARRTTLLIDAPPRLIRPVAGLRDRLRMLPHRTAHERCERLGEDGLASSFQAAGGDWECLFSTQRGTTPEPSVLFIQVKGASSSTFRTFRLKLSLLDPGKDDEMFKLVARSIDRFGIEMAPENLHYLYDRIRTGLSFSSRFDGYRVSYERERDDDRRFNLLITQLPETSTCGQSAVSSNGAAMHSSIVRFPIECLPLQQRTLSRPIQPN
ncbi:DUF6030 family protein [Rhizobium sp. ZW T2_16]|uniref:DUF6030 family protein n=1 Tax=Rhizobium sp. ZW T2_16 TaxID=3378083 RepID=UPI003853A136